MLPRRQAHAHAHAQAQVHAHAHAHAHGAIPFVLAVPCALLGLLSRAAGVVSGHASVSRALCRWHAAAFPRLLKVTHKRVALNPSVYAQPWAVWPCGGGTRPGEARNWGADQPRSTCVERTYDWTHMQTRKHTRTYAYTHTSPFPASSSFPAPPVVLVTACRPGHCLSCMSPPCVQRCHAAMLARRPRRGGVAWAAQRGDAGSR